MNKIRLFKIALKKYRKIVSIGVTTLLLSTPEVAISNGVNRSTFSLEQQIGIKKVTLNIRNKTLDEILLALCKQAEMKYGFHSSATIDKRPNYSLVVKDGTVKEALTKLLSGSNYDYRIENDKIIITNKSNTNQATASDGSIATIKGRVVDESGKPIAGATLIIAGTDNGAISDENGDFKINSKVGSEIELTYVGYKSKKIKSISGNMVIKMELEAMTVDDVVVTGIYTRNSESFTGSSSTFKASELKNVGGQNLLQSLKTLDPSFAIIENNDFGSDPNRLPDIEIRGKSSVIGLKEQFGTDPNQPLFILDGFETDLKTIVDLNMDRVESVTLLKDAASTAIYGSKAANGVVVVETKKPEKGKFRITYSGNVFISFPDLSDYNLMNASEKLAFELEAGRYKAPSYSSNAKEQLFLDSLYNLNRAEVARGVDTYWMSEPLRTAVTHKHNLYAEGGDDIMRYGVGATYNGTSGVMKQSGNDLIGFNFDLSYRRNNFLVSNKMYADYYKSEDPIVRFSEFSRANPYYRKDGNGDGVVDRYLADFFTGARDFKVENPMYNASLNSFNENEKYKFENKLSMEYKFLPQLTLRGRFGLGVGVTKKDNFISPLHPNYDKVSFEKKGEYVTGSGNDLFYDGDITLSYGQLLGEHHQINAVIGARMRSDESESETSSSIGFPIGDFARPSFATGYTENGKPTYFKNASRSNSLYFNGGYSYKNRYLLDANIRMDGTSIFGSNKRFTETWAIGLAWNIHNERFMNNAKIINRLKIRASIGNPGNQNFSSFQSYTTYVFNNWIQNAFGPSMIISNFGNSDLKWQKTIDKNIGFDLTMFGNRLNVNFDYYNKMTDPLLAKIAVPASIGVRSVLTNMGGQLNQGFSGTIKYSPIYRPNERINWTLSLNFRHQTAEYRNIGNSLDQFNQENKNVTLSRYYNGGSPTSLWSVRSLGINPSDGREAFLTKDGKYTFDYNYEDEVIVGNSEPKLAGVFGSTFYYKGFSFSLFLRYSLGADLFNEAVYSKVENISSEQLKYNQDKRALYDRWRHTGDKAKYKGISLTETTPISSRFLLTENYIAGESFSVGYDFSTAFIQKIGMQSLRVQANMNDIFRISTVKEERGIEYPFARSISMSLSVTF